MQINKNINNAGYHTTSVAKVIRVGMVKKICNQLYLKNNFAINTSENVHRKCAPAPPLLPFSHFDTRA